MIKIAPPRLQTGSTSAGSTSAEPTSADASRRAMALHRNGDLGEAEKLYRSMLASSPKDFDALHLLGVLLSSKREFEEGIRLIKRALELEPDFPGAHNNLGTALLAAKQPAEALSAFTRAVALKPDFAEAHSNLGNALAELKRFEEAVASHQRALGLKPDYPEGHNNLGNALLALGRFEEAAAACQRAVKLRPAYAKAYNNLAVALAGLRRYGEAISTYRRAIAANSQLPEAHRGLGNALLATGLAEEAVLPLRRAIELRPGYSEAHNDLGRAYGALRQVGPAVESYRRAIELQPANGEAHNNLGNALLSLELLDQAAASYQRAAELMPADSNALVQSVHVSRRMCAWRESASDTEALLRRVRLASFNGPTFPLLSIVDDPAVHLVAAQAYVRNSVGGDAPALWTGETYDHVRIKIGYFSYDFREHPVARLIVDLLECHDKSQFEVHGVSFGPDDKSALRRRISRACDHFVDVRELSDDGVAQKIRELEIDILIDLNGHTEGGRGHVLARRPAPVQVSYLGYPATTGAEFIDYAIVDKFVAPLERQPLFTEKLVHLPDCFQVSDSKRLAPEVAPARSAHGLPENHVVFCCFNNSYKITPAIFDVWMRLLRAVPGSVLWLVGDNQWAQTNLRAEASSRGVAPERLIFAPRCDYPAFLARLGAADLFLDTAPYNGGATANDALWCGLPVLTCPGESFASRMASSLLLASGLPELVAGSLADYEQRAIELATQPDRLRAMRSRLATSKATSPLFDTGRFCRNLEAAYCEMVRVVRDGELPSSFAIETGTE